MHGCIKKLCNVRQRTDKSASRWLVQRHGILHDHTDLALEHLFGIRLDLRTVVADPLLHPPTLLLHDLETRASAGVDAEECGGRAHRTRAVITANTANAPAGGCVGPLAGSERERSVGRADAGRAPAGIQATLERELAVQRRLKLDLL
jgi:hypothetical protein